MTHLPNRRAFLLQQSLFDTIDAIVQQDKMKQSLESLLFKITSILSNFFISSKSKHNIYTKGGDTKAPRSVTAFNIYILFSLSMLS